jgi:hypothetical protein
LKLSMFFSLIIESLCEILTHGQRHAKHDRICYPMIHGFGVDSLS